jgi:diguanylate cyclase (GGDEF)-like protein/PAS domain S-box-containing protein
MLLDPGDGRVLRHVPVALDGGQPAQLRQLCLDGQGNLWIATTRGLLRLSAGAETPEQVAAGQIGDAQRLLLDHDGHLLVSTIDGLHRMAADGSAQRIWSSGAGRTISAMVEDAQHRLWLAVPHHGIALFDPARDNTQWLTPGSELAGSVPDAIITTLQLDRSGLLWLGTHERGLAKVDPAGTLFRYVVDVDPTHRPTSANYVRSLFEDNDATLWVGTEDGLKRYYPGENRFESYDDLAGTDPGTENRAPRLVVHAFAPAEAGRLWVGTSQGAGLFDPVQRTVAFLPVDPTGANGLADSRVRALLRARDGSLWIGTTQGGLAHYDPRAETWSSYRHAASAGAIGGLSDDRVFVLHEDRHGRIWSGNMTGLNLVDPAQRSVRVFRSGGAQTLTADLVRAIHESDDGELWIGTQSGLNRLDALDGATARFSRWLPRDGLPGGTVYAIASDAMGRLWLSTNRGIAAFDRSSNAFRSFTLADGLQGMEYNGGATARLRDGQLAFGGVNGFNLFLPQAMVGSRYAAPVVFTALRIGRNETPVQPHGKQVEMALADRVVRFEFAALDFSAPERNRFAYRLQGFDERWIDVGTRHEATYTNLDAGRYVFQVRAANHDGYWGDEVASIGLRVTPPWWDSLAARTAYVLFGGALLLLGWRTQRERRREERHHHIDLQEREDRLRLALWGSGDDFWDWDIARETIVVTGCSDLFKNAPRQPITRNHHWLREHVHPDDLPAAQRRLEQHISRATDTFESEHRLRNQRGEWVWSLARGKIVERDGDGQPLRMCGTARDVTLTRAAEHDRRIAQEVIRSMGEAVAVTDTAFQFLSVNPAFARITGWRHEEIVGRSASLLNCSQHAPEHYLAMREELTRSGHWRGELWQRRKNGEEFLSWVQVSEVRDAGGQRTHFVSVISDITDRKRTEQELRYLANYDALTGLPNRTLLTERIGHAIIRARRGTRKVAVLFLDLDRFKHVNDSMGHAVGDRMLKAAGSRLRQVVREGDSVARIGGDEFTVVLENIGSGAEAERVAEKIIAAFEQPLELDNGQEVVISPSIGISLHPDHGQVPSDLLKFADTAMYQAKEHGRKTWMVYTEAMDAAARLRATTVTALRKALERNELSLVYQPKLSLLDERITGVEALLRWRSADLGNVSPGVFIPIAEETGLIIEIGDWVVAQAVAQLARWRDVGVCDITMSINVSVAQLLRGDLIRRLCDVLAEHDIAPNLLELELTESMVMANAEQSITTLRRLKAVGVTLAIDDFGTGYSSLSYLKRLPIDTLKIDKEFVGDITTDPDDEAITATVITMAHSLGLNVVAEGVERAEQVEYLREQDCDEVQGHWLAFPLPPDQCLAFLRERAERRRLALGESP